MPFYIVKALKTFLLSPLTTVATSVVLKKLQDSKGNNLTMADFGTFGVIVIKQGDTIEMIKFTAIATDADTDVATLTVASSGRNLDPTEPYAGYSTGNAFQSGAEAIITNDPLTVSQYANKDNSETITGLWSFPTPSAGAQAATKDYVDAQNPGAVATYNRLILPGTAGETLVAGNLLYFDLTDKEWKKCDADTASTVENTLKGIAQGSGVDGGTISGGVLLFGMDENQSGLTSGVPYYASNTAGAVSSTVGTKEVTVGIAFSATKLYFNPQYNQQLTEDQQDALAGSHETPSATNKFVTARGIIAGNTQITTGTTGAGGAGSVTITDARITTSSVIVAVAGDSGNHENINAGTSTGSAYVGCTGSTANPVSYPVNVRYIIYI